jgi:hydroxypyruvate reductase/glycerate 2-kinase
MSNPGRLPPEPLREQAREIWQAAVAAVRPEPLVEDAVCKFPDDWKAVLASAPRILVVGAGKAGAAMAAGLEAGLGEHLDRVVGLVNLPEGSDRPLARVRLHAARPAGSNHPTAAGVAGAEEMLRLLESAGPNDVAICLLSGGGSALLPAPAEGVSLEAKQHVTKLLHSAGAAIGEMNAVRKHLSRVKGGGLAKAFGGRLLISLIISDVVGDPLDVIASGPTAPDPTTFADALAVLERYRLVDKAPEAVVERLRAGVAGSISETPKQLPANVANLVIGSNAVALAAARSVAERFGYRVLNLGPFIEGETREVAAVVAGLVRSIQSGGEPVRPPACVLIGGETTVALGPDGGLGGRNQEFVLAALVKLGAGHLDGVCVLSGGTDGEDGPTEAAGAVGTLATLERATALGLDPRDCLDRHDSFPFFNATGGLIRTGLTGTNVMDVRVVLVT